MTKTLAQEIAWMKKNIDNITTSDLQGIAGALSMRYNVSDDDILEEVYK